MRGAAGAPSSRCWIATAITAIQLDMLGSQFEFNYVRYILFALILLVMLRYRRQGLLPEPLDDRRGANSSGTAVAAAIFRPLASWQRAAA